MIWLLLLASLSQAQEVSSGTVNLLDEVRISNLGKDTRDLLSGRYRQTGKPTFAGGICFADGTCQTTAAAAGAWNISRSSGATDQTNATTNFAAVVGSTVSLTVSEGSLVLVTGHFIVSDTVDNVGCQIKAMQVAANMTTPAVNCAFYAGSGSARPGVCSFSILTAALTAGTYTFSAMFRTTTGGTTCQIDGATTAPWAFIAVEVPQ